MKSPNRIYLDRLIINHIEYLRGKILNVGGGTKTYKILSKNMVVIDNYDKNPSGNKISSNKKADITKTFPFDKNEFDSVICTQVLEHIHNPQHVVDEIFRVLKIKGCLMLSVPFLERFHPDPNDYWRFTEQGIKEILKDFKIIKIVPIGGRFLWLQTFLYQHKQIPRFAIKMLKPFVKLLSKKEQNQNRWTIGFFIIAKKI